LYLKFNWKNWKNSKFFKKTDNVLIRDYLITLRSCITRYGYHIEAFNDKAPEMIRFSKDDLKANVTISAEEVEQDKIKQE